MNLKFVYDINRDVENIIRGTKAINSKTPTNFQNLFTEKCGSSFEPQKIKLFIKEQDKINNFDLNKEIIAIEEMWKIVESTFIERVEKIFRISYPSPHITAYLTHNERCTYNIEKNYFFVKIRSKFSNNIIMHELLHFYTWHTFGQRLLDKGLSRLAFNDINESLTELLNLEFVDLLNGKTDKGYPRHKTIRSEIKNLWLKHKDIRQIVDLLSNQANKRI